MNSYDRTGQYEPAEEVNLADDPEYVAQCERNHAEAMSAQDTDYDQRMERAAAALGAMLDIF